VIKERVLEFHSRHDPDIQGLQGEKRMQTQTVRALALFALCVLVVGGGALAQEINQDEWTRRVVVQPTASDPFTIQMSSAAGFEYFAILDSKKQFIIKSSLATHTPTISY
jgi:hypothetical protein